MSLPPSLTAWLQQLAQKLQPLDSRPRVTLAYAQSLNGCLSAQEGEQTLIGGETTRVFAHRLRTLHEGILVGVNTILVDDPQLNVRHVQGSSPRPIVVDSQLRTPPTARVLTAEKTPWIATAPNADPRRAAALEQAGAQILPTPQDEHGRLNLKQLFVELARRGLHSLMIEGGAQIITSVLQQRLADQAAVTIAPCWLAGAQLTVAAPPLQLLEPNWHIVGEDSILTGEITLDAST